MEQKTQLGNATNGSEPRRPSEKPRPATEHLPGQEKIPSKRQRLGVLLGALARSAETGGLSGTSAHEMQTLSDAIRRRGREKKVR